MIQRKNDMENCTLCPRKCGADRYHGKTGVCGQTAELKVARADLHMWEEPCISGEKGSGAVFFSGCTLRCVYCQNYNIAAGNTGKIITVERLSEIFMNLQEKGANNINLVTAGHFVPQVIEALDKAKKSGLKIPIVYNTSAYEEVKTLRMLEGYVDIYLPDLKYADNRLSEEYSHAPDYFEKAKEAIAEMVRQVGDMEFQKESEQGENLIMKKGVIVRHLVLPGCVNNAKAVVDYLLKTYGNRIFISIMNQYTPLEHVSAYPKLTRKVTAGEYERVLSFALEKGIENGFIQEGNTAKESFIPEFDGKGV